jgi:hypothetical protein
MSKMVVARAVSVHGVAVLRPIHLAHPARAERRDDLVGAETRAGFQRHVGRNYRPLIALPALRPGAPRLPTSRGAEDGKAIGSLLEFAPALALDISASQAARLAIASSPARIPGKARGRCCTGSYFALFAAADLLGGAIARTRRSYSASTPAALSSTAPRLQQRRRPDTANRAAAREVAGPSDQQVRAVRFAAGSVGTTLPPWLPAFPLPRCSAASPPAGRAAQANRPGCRK